MLKKAICTLKNNDTNVLNLKARASCSGFFLGFFLTIKRLRFIKY
jgi:hypothetical protein